MGWLDFGRDDERKPLGGLVQGYGNSYHTSSDAASNSYLANIGQTTDRVTGITGRNGQEVMDKGKAMGLSDSALSDLFDRITEK